MTNRTDLLQGSLDLLVLKAIQVEPLHGWGIAKRIKMLSADALSVTQGSLYPALYRLEDQGWVTASWGVSAEGRRAKFYTLTPSGRDQLGVAEDSWRRFSLAVNMILSAG